MCSTASSSSAPAGGHGACLGAPCHQAAARTLACGREPAGQMARPGAGQSAPLPALGALNFAAQAGHPCQALAVRRKRPHGPRTTHRAWCPQKRVPSRPVELLARGRQRQTAGSVLAPRAPRARIPGSAAGSWLARCACPGPLKHPRHEREEAALQRPWPSAYTRFPAERAPRRKCVYQLRECLPAA